MRNLFSILNLILCFELIVSPIAPNLSLISVARAEGCPAGLQMDPTLNRCLTTAQQANVMNATASCAQGDTACYVDNAKKAFQDKVNAGDAPERKGGGGFLSKVTTIAAVAGPVTMVALGLKDSAASCMSPSMYAMIAGAAALIIGDNLANLQHKKRLKKIKEEWGKVVNPEQAAGDKDKERETSIEAQSEAFIKLAEAEESLVKAAKMKKMFFMVATLAYGASTVLALMEKKKSAALSVAATTSITTANASNQAASAVNPVSATAAAITAALQANKAALTANQVTIDAASAAAAAVPVAVPGAAAASGATAQSATSKALTAKAQASTLVAEATAAVKAATAAQAAAAALPMPANAAALTAANLALANTQAALTAANALNADTQASLCTSMGVAAYVPQATPTSLYSYYTGEQKLDIRQEIQSLYNLENSQDMASFLMNQNELIGKTPSVEEYISYKNDFAEVEAIDKSIFEIFKATSLALIRNVNPLPSAHADQAENLVGAEESSGGGSAGGSGGGSAPNSGSNVVGNVETNAAKAYKDDEGKGIDLMSIGIGIGVGYLLAIKSGLREKLITPTGRAIFSGVMAGMTLLMSQHAGSQAEASQKRADLLRKMAAEFNDAAGAVNACRSEDRSDPGKPTCYCYTPENQRNNNRGNSAVCQKLWAGLSLKPTNYLAGTQSGKVCISNSNKADPTCACKQTKSCMKVGMSGIQGLNAGTMSMLGQSLAPVNGIANGSIDAANLNGAALANQAAKMADLVKKIEGSKGMEAYKKNKGKLEAKLRSDLARGAASLPANSMLGGGSGSNMPSNPKDAALMLEKELDQPLPTGVAGNDQIMAPGNSASEPALEFGMTADQLAEQEGQIAEVMNQNLDYGGNDINQGSKTNIFDVLSNRYQRSGMRRLFDEKGTTEAEKPAETDIAQ